MIIGYGASGSGKTSTLVNLYNRDAVGNEEKNQPGIMIHMANSLVDTYDKLEVSFIELEANVSCPEEDIMSKCVKITPNQQDLSLIHI